jgi:hypothetical protein
MVVVDRAHNQMRRQFVANGICIFFAISS